jgi:quercetin dioxygenase-like cupin family protein
MTHEDASAASTAYWFLDTLAVVHSATPPLVIEITVPPGGSPPLHVHDGLDDSSYLLDGRLAVRCGESTFRADPGAYLPQPRGVPHTFRVLGDRPARMLLVHGDDSFLRLIRALGVPARSRTLPSGMTPVPVETLEQALAEVGVSVVGPSMTAQEADAIALTAAGPRALPVPDGGSGAVPDIAGLRRRG